MLKFCSPYGKRREYSVNPGSKAAAKGIREGDIITSINGENTRDRTNSEAHALLKAAGNRLKLGLNQDCSGGSPKKRQYNNTNNKSVQQETHSETIKRSNTTTTTYIVNSSTTTTTSDTTTPKNRVDFEYAGPKSLSNERIGFSKENNEYNGIRINGDSKSTGKDYFSDRSTISSNYSSAASTPSTLTEYQVGDERASPQDDPSSSTDIEDSTMADNARNSRSSSSKRRRRSNNDNNKRKGKERNDRDTVRPSTVPATDASADSERLCDSTRYRVESPKTVPKKTRKGSITKSRSLDDDDQVKIQELSESSGSDEKSSRYRCSNAIVVEADSEEVEWEITADLVIGSIIPQHIRTMTTETLKLEEKIPPKIITPEDESNLRYFLEGLDLVTSPEEAARKTQERETAETIRARRAKKREELAQYFLPVYQNPRFLDVISEEGSDLSDREQREKKKTVLTETDSSRIPVITCTTTVTETSVSSDVEIVYLESSDSESDESADYADIEEESNDAIGSIPSSQLTPPPTPDDVSPKNGVVSNTDFIRQTAALIVEEDFDALREVLKDDVRFKRLPGDLQRRIHQLNLIEDKEDIPKAPIQRINVVSPSILSECSGESSSRGTSLCTTIFKDEEGLVSQPLTLKEFCLNKLISLPFGKDVLEELASVSRSLQDLTNNLSSRKHVVEYYHHHNHHNHHSNNNQNNPCSPAFTTSAENRDILTPENVTSTNASFHLVSARKAMPERAKDNRDKWVGMPSEDDPQLVVCLSPTQKTFLETTKKIPDETAKLLDLHAKFASRRQYHENIKDGDESEMTNRLLAIIRHAGNNSEIAATKTEDPDDYLYYVEKQNNQIGLPRSNSLEETPNDSARLKTHNLSEWLRLARDKSKSDPHLNIFNDSKEIIAINLPKITNQTATRRRSLPQEIYVQQMQYLIQKEKEIQQELEKLEEEKRKLTSEMSDVNPNNRQFDPSKYHISKNEDIAIHNDELTTKSSSKATPSTERFRQEMYDEYMVQIAKRQDRQQNKVIKISSHQIQSPPEKRTDEKLEVTHVKGIEDEFMCKVKQLKQKYGLNAEDTDYASLEKSDAEDSEPVLVMDGDHLSDAKKLPKHLKEFVDITRQAAGALDKDTEDGELWLKRLELQWMLCDLSNVFNL